MAREISPSSVLDVKSRSVKRVLSPLIAQVGILMKNCAADISNSNEVFTEVLANLELSVCNLTSIGHEMGNGYIEIRDEMSEACDMTNKASSTLVSILNINKQKEFDKGSLGSVSNSLLSAITKILILADKTAIAKMVISAEKVDKRLQELENVSHFNEFITAFSQFGSDMVELAYISGERQNDLINDLQRAEVCASRAILEKSTMMLLTTCKTCLRHPDSPLAMGNRVAVFQSMRNAMKILKSIIRDDQFPTSSISRGILIDYQELEDSVKNCTKNGFDIGTVESLCENVDNIAIDMENVINVQQINPKSKGELKKIIAETKDLYKQLKVYVVQDQVEADHSSILALLNGICEIIHDMISELKNASFEQLTVTLHQPPYKELLRQLKGASLSGQYTGVEEQGEVLEKELQSLIEVAKLVKNCSNSEACIVTASRIEENLISLLPQIIDAGKMLAGHPSSKITQENLEVFIDVWDTQIDELLTLLQNIAKASRANGCAEWLSIYVPMASKLNS